MRRLRALYFVHYAAIGLMVPWLAAFLESRGLGGRSQGLLLALRTGATIVASPLLGLAADRWGVGRVLRFASLASLATAAWLLRSSGMAAFTAVFLLMAAGITQVAPLTDAAILVELEGRGSDDRRRFGPSRLWGSLGFACAALLFGLLFRGADQPRTSQAAMEAVLVLSGITVALAWITPGGRRAPAPPTFADARRLLAAPGVKPILLAGALQWMCLSPYHAFFGEHLEHHGGDASIVGLAIAAAVVVEVAVMATAPRWLPRLDARPVLAFSALAGVLRWTLTALASPGWVVAAQALHGLSYGAFFLAMIDGIVRRTPPERRGTAIGLVAGLSIGGGTLIGTLVSGELYAVDQGRLLFLAAAGFSLAPALAALFIPPLEEAPASGGA